MWNGPNLRPPLASRAASVDELVDCSDTLDEEAEMLALKLMSMSWMAMYGIGTIVNSGTFSCTTRPFCTNWNDTFTASFWPVSGLVFSPTSWINCHDVCAAIACASIHAFNGPPIILPKGIACNALVATCDGVVSIAIVVQY